MYPAFASEAITDVKVRLDPPKSQVKISGFALQVEAGGEVQSLRLVPARDDVTITTQAKRWTIKIAGKNGTPSEEIYFTGETLKISGEMLRLGKDEVPNELTLFADSRNRIEPVAQLPLEEYLKGVIPSEMPATWPLDALKAQAIASRSYALHVARSRSNERYHLDASTNHQVFKLINYLSAKGAARDNIVRAVEETRGVVLNDSSGDIYKAFYHADCGGATEEPKSVWGYGSKNGTVKDSRCAMSSHGAWQATLSTEKLQEGVRKTLNIPADHTFIDVRLEQPTASGRMEKIIFIFADGGSIAKNFSMSTQQFRETFGFDLIRSTRFTITRTPEEFRFAGRGHGHGAGMCQFGARFMAMGGADFKSILKRYYQTARLLTE